MGEKTKEKRIKTPTTDEKPPNKAENERSYYYDDAHGYEIFRDDEDNDELPIKSGVFKQKEPRILTDDNEIK